MISIQFLYPENLISREMDRKGIDELYNWEFEVVDELAKNCFSQVNVASAT